MRVPVLAALAAVLSLAPRPARAQTWNGDSALALAERAILRRTRTTSDTALRDYKAQAHGFVFFLGQFGEGLTDPPRLLKADQLELEVYWKAPRLSKQRIVGWRDRAELPTDIQYHTDHLGIVQNNFGPIIRLGEGDEVRDVVHPLAPGGTRLYDFALGDTLSLALPERDVQVIALEVRPKDFTRPGLVGTLYVDRATADLVRMRFSFTPASYRDRQLEDIGVTLDNGLWEGRFWLPYRQDIEIRRRATWLDVPVRGIIRGRWEIDGYVLNLGLAESWFRRGREIEAVPRVERDSFPWVVPLDAAVRELTQPLQKSDFEEVRQRAEAIAGRQVLSGLKAQRLGVRRVSDLLHANRVEGLAPGAGFVWRLGRQRVEVRGTASVGLADGRWKGSVGLSDASGLEASAYRAVRDVGDVAVGSPLVNSLASQEFGDDYGDYYLADGARLGLRRRLGTRGEWSLVVARERIRSLGVRATPATGTFRPNPPLGDTTVGFVELGLRRKSGGFGRGRDVSAELAVEAGRADGADAYVRATAQAQVRLPVAGTEVVARVLGGTGSAALPRHRVFVLGGRGTLLGDEFRRWGGRDGWLAHLEWRLPVQALSLRVGTVARVAAPLTLAPYVAAGGAGRPVPATPWVATSKPRITVGLGLEWLGIVRLDAGFGTRSRRIRFAFDVSRDFWGIL